MTGSIHQLRKNHLSNEIFQYYQVILCRLIYNNKTNNCARWLAQKT